jgi:hypothetical protein
VRCHLYSTHLAAHGFKTEESQRMIAVGDEGTL